jgi:hypothetical protein
MRGAEHPSKGRKHSYTFHGCIRLDRFDRCGKEWLDDGVCQRIRDSGDRKLELLLDTQKLVAGIVIHMDGTRARGGDGDVRKCTSDDLGVRIENGVSRDARQCLTATCDQWENGKSISSIDTSQASWAKTDSDLARPPGGDHPAAQQVSLGVLTGSAARRGQSAAQLAHQRPSDMECSTQRLEDATSQTTR